MSADCRLHLEIEGAVQGVGFRPHAWRLAHELELAGWVQNGTAGVVIEVEGPRGRLLSFERRVLAELPPAAVVHRSRERWIDPVGERGFAIVASADTAIKSTVVLPDLATCPDCLRELFDPADRRFRYPFTNCTHCGPRFTIVHDLPYDRERTTMHAFELCARCRAEYENPADRRFHAQPVACPACGPRLELIDPLGRRLEVGDAALIATAQALGAGKIVALKGIGGYQLLVDARDEGAVARLRERKRRPAKPLALLVADLSAARAIATVSTQEDALLASARAPIVILQRRSDARLAHGIAPGNATVGVMLPTTPLHHLLARETGFPLVATSGNRSDEPIAIEDDEALARLGAIADLFLVHDRPIARPVDDGVAWIVEGAPQPIRRARGEAPLPVLLPGALVRGGPTLVAVGAHQKDVAALALGRQVFLSQHLGDMETPEARSAFERVILDFVRIYDATPVAIAHDLHPDYPTTRWAQDAARPAGGLLEHAGRAPGELTLVPVQHHHAHLAAALADAEADAAVDREADGKRAAPALALTWDGTGFGPDGTVWGGEALLGDAAGFERVARLRPFRLPGGEAAVRSPWRVALALLWQVEGERAFERGFAGRTPELARLSVAERAIVRRMIVDGLRSHSTSSAGRLFDGVAALIGLGGIVSFEGEAAMRLEQLASPGPAIPYPIDFEEVDEPEPLAPGQRRRGRLLELDWRSLIAAIASDRERGVEPATISARFHSALAAAGAELARRVDAERVALTGGCFQNRRLTHELCERLTSVGRRPLIHRRVPANDGGIALGQVAVARARLAG